MSQISYDFHVLKENKNPFIERVTHIDLKTSEGYKKLHYIFPVGRHHLALTSRGDFRIFSPHEEYQLPEIALCGCFTWAYYFGASEGHNSIYIITLNPMVLYQKFGVDVAKIAHRHVDLRQYMDWDVEPLARIIDAQPTACEMAEGLSSYLHGFAKFDNNVELTASVLQTSNHNPEMNLQDICNELDISRSKIDRDFTRVMGVSPGKYFGLMRIYNVLMAMVKKPEATIEQLSAFFNYADHSHLIKDFRKRLGMSPSEFKQQELDVLKNYLMTTPASYINIHNL